MLRWWSTETLELPSSMDTQNSDLDELFVEDNTDAASKHTPPGVALPQECLVCTVSVASKMALIAHMKHFHPGARPYSCNNCERRFNNEADLGCHNTNVHFVKCLFTV